MGFIPDETKRCLGLVPIYEFVGHRGRTPSPTVVRAAHEGRAVRGSARGHQGIVRLPRHDSTRGVQVADLVLRLRHDPRHGLLAALCPLSPLRDLLHVDIPYRPGDGDCLHAKLRGGGLLFSGKRGVLLGSDLVFPTEVAFHGHGLCHLPEERGTVGAQDRVPVGAVDRLELGDLRGLEVAIHGDLRDSVVPHKVVRLTHPVTRDARGRHQVPGLQGTGGVAHPHAALPQGVHLHADVPTLVNLRHHGVLDATVLDSTGDAQADDAKDTLVVLHRAEAHDREGLIDPHGGAAALGKRGVGVLVGHNDAALESNEILGTQRLVHEAPVLTREVDERGLARVHVLVDDTSAGDGVSAVVHIGVSVVVTRCRTSDTIGVVVACRLNNTVRHNGEGTVPVSSNTDNWRESRDL